MPDYNIYLTSLSTEGDNSPTTPWQLRDNSSNSGGESGDNIGDGFNPSNIVKRGASFIQNPDGIIASVIKSPVGKLGIIGVVAGTVTHIVDKAYTMYQSYSSSASGNYKYQIAYDNFKQTLHNIFTPFSTEIQRQFNALQIKKENLANEQERLLLGGSIINSPYGRYL